MIFTTKTQLSEKIGISKQTLNYRANRLNIDLSLKKITPEDFLAIKNFSKKSRKNKKVKSKKESRILSPENSEIDQLKKEIDEKNQQISELHKLLSQSQQLQLKQSEKIELLENVKRKKGKFWSRFFGD
uniref:DUF536 domain-containing protein n=1 Tax=Pediococcus pentosaceus TaxID=1255 RepID=A0A1B4Z3L8_PEDPE|nr:hypothetical protein [Pediococcus pentosaceus]BAV54017.1 hypothetical protein [Pediococcus pentosaceus]